MSWLYPARSASVWLGGGMLLALAAAARLPAAEQADRSQRDAAHTVGEALQREIYGLDSDRRDLLEAAAADAPQFAPARWHLGFVKDEKRGWLRFDEYLQIPKAAATLHKYERQRAATPDTVEGNLRLADWCAEERLAEQERAHLMRVVDLNPDHAAARQRLGFVRQGSDWLSGQEIAAAQASDQARRSALSKWRPVVDDIRAGLTHRSQQRRDYAAKKLRELHDLDCIAALEEVFSGAADEIVLPVVGVISEIADPAAAASLTRFAVYWPTPAVREAATQKLGLRPRDTYVPELVGSMYSPVVSRFVAINLPSGRIGYRHAFVREGEDRRQVVLLDTEYRRIALIGGSGRDSEGRALADAAATAREREAAAALQNQLTTALNDRLAWVLATATGVKLPAQPEAWWTWWSEQNEVFVQGTKPTSLVQSSRQVAIVDRVLSGSQGGGSVGSGSAGPPRVMDCLAAGTPVRTTKGPVAIEAVRVGDLVLSQHPESGELAYKPVLRTTIRPSGKLVRIEAGGETFQTSGGHLFWVAGAGWTKARELVSGQVLHAASGPVHVISVESGSEAQTYNLVVADFSTYFVGQNRLLSHDNTVRTPTKVLVPGLLQP